MDSQVTVAGDSRKDQFAIGNDPSEPAGRPSGNEKSGDGDRRVFRPRLRPYSGMTRDELLQLSDVPFWNNLRTVLVVIFWIGWLAVVASVVGLTVAAPRCQPRPETTWFQRATVVQIYVRSFFDSDDDGDGDINGITEKLDYLKESSVDGVLLSSVLRGDGGPGEDLGYSATDFRDVDPLYGTVDDIRNLVAQAHGAGMKVLMDFPAAMTSASHQWFLDSGSNPERSFYSFDASCPASNWISVYDQPAWFADPGNAAECYVSNFLERQPALNLRSSVVQAEIEQSLEFWLTDVGLDGVRIIGADFLTQNSAFSDDGETCAAETFDCRDGSRSRAQPDTYSQLARWRSNFDKYGREDGNARVLIADVRYSGNRTKLYLGDSDLRVAHLVTSNLLVALNATTCGASCIATRIEDTISQLPPGGSATWMVSSYDVARVASSYGTVARQYSAALNLIVHTLPGTVLTLYGDELGVVENVVTESVDPPGNVVGLAYSRDPYRSLMQWDDSDLAGFSGNESAWTAPNPDYQDHNVKVLQSDPSSQLGQSRDLAGLHRDHEAFHFGAYRTVTTANDVLAYTLIAEGLDRFLVVVNLGSADAEVDVSGGDVPRSAELLVKTGPDVRGDVGDDIDLRYVRLKVGQGVLCTWEYSR